MIDNGATLLTATMKFGIELINSNRKEFRYNRIWGKVMPVGFANSHKMPLRTHELVLVFYKRLPTYNPQGLIELPNPVVKQKYGKVLPQREQTYPTRSLSKPYTTKYTNYPRDIIRFSNSNNNNIHPTQKPLDLIKYFILTYTNPVIPSLM